MTLAITNKHVKSNGFLGIFCAFAYTKPKNSFRLKHTIYVVKTLTFTFHLYLFQREIYGKVAEELAAKKRDPCWIYPMAKEEATTILRARVKASVKLQLVVLHLIWWTLPPFVW